MASPKNEEFKKTETDIAAFAKTISHPARVAILNTLAEKNMCICGEIVSVLPLSQSTVSQHLIELKKAGLVQGTIDGQKSCYCIDWKVLNENIAMLGSFTEKLEALKKNSNQNCC